jgi:hypothetical protein
MHDNRVTFTLSAFVNTSSVEAGTGFHRPDERRRSRPRQANWQAGAYVADTVGEQPIPLADQGAIPA